MNFRKQGAKVMGVIAKHAAELQRGAMAVVIPTRMRVIPAQERP
ncbi:hypothetical protein BH11PLA1_BH11PLA1_10890 [soil metagenome]